MHPANAPNDRPTYFITFTTYGTWLPGDERGSTERLRSPGVSTPVEPNPHRKRDAEGRMLEPPFTLNVAMRETVAGAAMAVCEYRGWTLHAINVRTNHVHLVVSADSAPEAVMTTVKSWSTRRMRDAGLPGDRTKFWTRHGSTRLLPGRKDLDDVLAYVIDGQGEDLGGLRGMDSNE